MFSAIDLDNLKPAILAVYQGSATRFRVDCLWITFAAEKSSMISTLDSGNVGKV
jgi:hypothetical protein